MHLDPNVVIEMFSEQKDYCFLPMGEHFPNKNILFCLVFAVENSNSSESIAPKIYFYLH
jgi:hypothetical protein